MKQQPTTATTTRGRDIPPRLKAEIDKYYKAKYKHVKAVEAKYNLPPTLTKHLLADLRSILYNDYKPLSITPDEITRLGAGNHNIVAELCRGTKRNHALQTLIHKYSTLITLLRLNAARAAAPAWFKPYIDHLARKKELGSLGVKVELKTYKGEQPNALDYITAASINYGEFIVLAALYFGATANELHAIPLPKAISEILNEEQLFSIKDELFSAILAICEYPIESINEHDKRVKEQDKVRLTLLKALKAQEAEDKREAAAKKATKSQAQPQAKTQAQAATQDAEQHESDPISQVAEQTASTISSKVIKLYQSNTATLSKPIEAISEHTNAIVGIGRKPQALGAIITALAEKQQISPKRVMQCLNGLQLLAQREDCDVIEYDGNEWYVYKDITATEAARCLTGLDAPNGEELREVAAALQLLSNLRIGHDEDHIYYTKDGKPIVKRYRHFTQVVNVPDIKVALDKDNNIKGGASFTLQLHRLIKKGKRTDKLIIEDEQKQRIADPVTHLVTLDEFSEARRLFPGEAGIRFYNTLKDTCHKKEADFIAQVFGYTDAMASAEYTAKMQREKAAEAAKKATTIEEAARIKADAEKAAEATIKAAKRNITNHRGRDKARLYQWLDMAVKELIIKPYKVTKAKDGSGDNVITWQTYTNNN